jgi:hypothetical protein
VVLPLEKSSSKDLSSLFLVSESTESSTHESNASLSYNMTQNEENEEESAKMLTDNENEITEEVSSYSEDSEPEKEKILHKISGNFIRLKTYRGDVVLKTILRLMRKTYLDDFNKVTHFIKSKRYRPSEFYL